MLSILFFFEDFSWIFWVLLSLGEKPLVRPPAPQCHLSPDYAQSWQSEQKILISCQDEEDIFYVTLFVAFQSQFKLLLTIYVFYRGC